MERQFIMGADAMKGLNSVFGLILAAGMLIYAVPQLQVGHGYSLETLFSVVWLGLALTVIASHLHGLLKVDQEVEMQVKSMKRAKSN
jgi:hypothetical protein